VITLNVNAVTCVVIFAYITLAWLRTVSSGKVSVMDVLWGLGFVIIAWTRAIQLNSFNTISVLTLIAVSIWGLRLAFVLHQRTKNRGEDPRYVRMMESAGKNWWWISFLQVFVLQGILLILVALPIISLISQNNIESSLSTNQLIGTALLIGTYCIGMIIEHRGDIELREFKKNSGSGQLKTDGIFSITRHPNHLGEAIIWWSIGGFAVLVGGFTSSWALIGPLILTLLLRYVSGVAMSEVDLKDREGYQQWVDSTPAMFANPIKILLMKNAD
jgi:steroid 5-alpha reductase family enzyme